jgi:hypothetical protein
LVVYDPDLGMVTDLIAGEDGHTQERALMGPLLACAVKRRRFPVGASPTRQPLQPEATGAAMEVTK